MRTPGLPAAFAVAGPALAQLTDHEHVCRRAARKQSGAFVD
jgi:hypothetical protein